MSQRANKKKSSRAGSLRSTGDKSPAEESAAYPSLSLPNQTSENGQTGSASPSEEPREFQENSDASPVPEPVSQEAIPQLEEPLQDVSTSIPREPVASLYKEVVDADEPVSAGTKVTDEPEEKLDSAEAETALPIPADGAALIAEDNSNFFKSFFSCCVGRK
jgi:hypothetical protein